MITPSLVIHHRNGNYPIFLGKSLLENPELLSAFIPSKQICIITDEKIAELHLPKVLATLTQYQCDTIILPSGESQKRFSTFERIIDQLIEKKHHRDTTLIAVGGGVIGDLTGFVAACYLRGVNFIQIPTTLLAQVDSSIGGKTAVNHPSGKNLIGVFYQPNAVIMDINTLNTLPTREFRAGIAEIIKTALIFDQAFFDWIEAHQEALLKQDSNSLLHAIKRACEIKAHFVSADETENDVRMHLNFGHTFGHAIEQVLNYQDWLHGEAVAYGMVVAANLSRSITGLPQTAYKRIKTLLTNLALVKEMPNNCSVEKLTAAMMRDKKIRRNKQQLILLSNIGTSIITDQVTQSMIESAWHIV